MSTRGVIARAREDGFLGVYHHSDSYPSGLGKTLWEAMHKYERSWLLKLLLDDHPAGWSTIVGRDLALGPGWDNGGSNRAFSPKPICYCHGQRHERTMPLTEADDADTDWAYVFDKFACTMAILERIWTGQPGQQWRVKTVVDLDDPEPDWEALEG